MSLVQKNGYQDFVEVNRKYKWILHNFSSFSDTPPKTKVTSQTLSHWIADRSLVNAEWKIDLYPNGWEDKDKGYISLVIRPLNYFRVIAYFNFTICSSVRIYNKCRIGPQLFDNSRGSGIDKVIKRDIVLNDLKKGNDSLIVIVKMIFSDKLKRAKPRDNLLQDIGLLLKTEENSDVILISSDGSEHKAHKSILICRSKVFSAMFHHNMKENQDNIVRIEDIDNKTLKAVLQFLYTGELDCTQGNIKNILIAADKYELDDLKRMGIDYLQENMRCDNVLDLVDFAHNYDFGELKVKAKKYILENYKKIMLMGPGTMKDLSRSILEELFHNVMENQKEKEIYEIHPRPVLLT